LSFFNAGHFSASVTPFIAATASDSIGTKSPALPAPAASAKELRTAAPSGLAVPDAFA
jgi:hypothetical protein